MNHSGAEGEPQDRRSHPRVEASVPIPARVGCWAELGSEKARIGNISCSGLYCTVPVYIPVATRVEICLNVPCFGESEKHREQVKFRGTVVRTEPLESENQYGLAIFFSGLTERARRLITQYVSHMQKRSA